jgi:hypothetical protein
MTFKSKIEAIGIRCKFWFVIKNMSDDDIIEFLKEDIFHCDDLTISFDEAKKRCEQTLGKSLDGFISKDDQEELYNILQEYHK